MHPAAASAASGAVLHTGSYAGAVTIDTSPPGGPIRGQMVLLPIPPDGGFTASDPRGSSKLSAPIAASGDGELPVFPRRSPAYARQLLIRVKQLSYAERHDSEVA